MKKSDVQKIKLGLYEVFWKLGGSSLAAVGNDPAGNRWLAPVNWVSVPSFTAWRYVSHIREVSLTKRALDGARRCACRDDFALDVSGNCSWCHKPRR